MFDTNSIEPAGLAMRDKVKAAFKAPTQSPTEDSPFVKKELPYYRDRGANRRTYYADHAGKKPVIDAKENSISTNYSDSKTVRAVLDMAQSRGWRQIRARGSESFRRETAIQGAIRGIAVDGYKLTQLDRQEIGQRMAASVAVPQQAASDHRTWSPAANPAAVVNSAQVAAAAAGSTAGGKVVDAAALWAKESAAAPAPKARQQQAQAAASP